MGSWLVPAAYAAFARFERHLRKRTCRCGPACQGGVLAGNPAASPPALGTELSWYDPSVPGGSDRSASAIAARYPWHMSTRSCRTSPRHKGPRPDVDTLVREAQESARARQRGYRERSLALHGWICAKCAREFDERAQARPLERRRAGRTHHPTPHRHDGACVAVGGAAEPHDRVLRIPARVRGGSDRGFPLARPPAHICEPSRNGRRRSPNGRRAARPSRPEDDASERSPLASAHGGCGGAAE